MTVDPPKKRGRPAKADGTSSSSSSEAAPKKAAKEKSGGNGTDAAFEATLFASQRESVLLAEIRDALLPQLFSGELRVADVAQVVEEAA